jgi:hypothetical protein
MTAARLTVSQCSVSTGSFLGHRPAVDLSWRGRSNREPARQGLRTTRHIAADGNEVLPGRQKSLLPRTSIKPRKPE